MHAYDREALWTAFWGCLVLSKNDNNMGETSLIVLGGPGFEDYELACFGEEIIRGPRTSTICAGV